MASAEPGSADLSAWLRFALTPIPPGLARQLLQHLGDPQAVLADGPRHLRAAGNDAAAAALATGPAPDLLDRTLSWLDAPGNSAVALDDPRYPALLAEIPDPPPVLFCKGDAALLSRPSLAVVGSRSATPQGLENAHAFARALSAAGITVVSGLALGIDGAAHRGALQEAASSIAVIATGPDLIYPSRNRALAHELAERGALVSEFPLGTRALAYNFPRRNRIISGLALGCLVVEASPDSGSLITARLAAEQGREVFAIPGSIHSPHARGCHALIRQGAKLVESAADILEEFGWRARPAPADVRALDLGEDETALLKQLGYDATAPDVVATRLGWNPDRVGATLAQLEVLGVVDRLPGGLYQRSR